MLYEFNLSSFLQMMLFLCVGLRYVYMYIRTCIYNVYLYYCVSQKKKCNKCKNHSTE